VAALPAFLQREIPPGDPWAAIYESAVAMPSTVLDERAALLGLPFAALGAVAPGDAAFGLPVGAVRLRNVGPTAGPPTGALTRARVLDLSSLWAGPLCGQLLAAGGADVVKVESISRPDGARRGPAAFFDLLNGTKRSVALDLETASGRRPLTRLLGSADVVIESARPRALEQMGIVATELLGQPGGPTVWVSITSHGRAPGSGQRVGFGDVAAVAGGLVACDAAGPCFLADAVTDPVTGLVAAAAVLEALHAGGHWLIDAAMAPMAAAVAGPLLTVSGLHARPPRARPVDRAAPSLGADTAAVLDRLEP
jgi:crotonobetainyl-CoA:carnitine CoA-transferase CaiB-like acyl-CoA transferase